MPFALTFSAASADIVSDLYTLMKSMMSAAGYKEAFAPKNGALREGASKVYDISVNKGVYAFTASCDLNCSDLDVIVRNTNGKIIGKDDLKDDAPIADATFSAATKVKVEVKMKECDANTCKYVFGGFIQK